MNYSLNLFCVIVLYLAQSFSVFATTPENWNKAEWIYHRREVSSGKTSVIKLEKDQINLLIRLIDFHAEKASPGTKQPPGPPPAAAPDLFIEIQTSDKKVIAQILGFNKEFIGLGDFWITEKNHVANFYKIVKRQ